MSACGSTSEQKPTSAISASRRAEARSLARQGRRCSGCRVKHLIVVEHDGDLAQLSGEGERRLVMRDRTRTVAADIEARPGNEAHEAQRLVEAAGRFAVDQQGGDVAALVP